MKTIRPRDNLDRKVMGQAIRLCRIFRGWNVAELSRRIGIKSGTVSNWEYGRGRVDRHTVELIHAETEYSPLAIYKRLLGERGAPSMARRITFLEGRVADLEDELESVKERLRNLDQPECPFDDSEPITHTTGIVGDFF